MARNFVSASSQNFLGATPPVTDGIPLTISAWMRTSGTTAKAAVCISAEDGSPRVQLYTTTGARTLSFAALDSVTAAVAETPNSYSDGVWCHAAATVTSTTSRAVYLNAGTAGTNTDSRSIAGFERINIGSRRSSSTDGVFFDGDLAEIGIWNVALSATEIASLAAGYSPLLVRAASLVAYYPLHGRLGAAQGEEAWVGSIALSQSNSPAVAAHPRIIYPWQQPFPVSVATPVAVKGTRLRLHSGSTAQASLTGLTAVWWDGTTPHTFGAPTFAVNDAVTDGDGWIELDLSADTALDVGDYGFMLVYKEDGTDVRDSLVFAGQVQVSDIG